MKILLYNYVQPDERGGPGGGVTVYLRNLSIALRAKGHEVITLSSGDRYNPLRVAPYLSRREQNEIVIFNSPVIAPAIYSFHHPDIYLNDGSLDEIPNRLLERLGNIDVFHFHNIEGLTRSFFYALRRKFPKSALIYSAHNYNLVCPQVNLWRNNSVACTNFHQGRSCITCVSTSYNRSRKLLLNTLKTPIKILDQRNSSLVSAIYSFDKYFSKRRKPSSTIATSSIERPTPKASDRTESSVTWENYYTYRQSGISLINDLFHLSLAVSERTKQILVSLGASKERLIVSYIGTQHMDRINTVTQKFPMKGNIHICYMGYMRREKGFFFFLDMIEKLPPSIASTIEVTIAAKFTDKDAVARMHSIAPAFRSFRSFDGYTHAELKDILEPVNLGIVCPLWEDNLPQVAIEFVTHGIPVLTSDMGGAQEISGNPDFIFDIHDKDSLSEKLRRFATGETDGSTFWSGNLRLRSNEQHSDEVLQLYAKAMSAVQQ